jgi:DNA-binding transcriptional MocR family regulator
MFQVVRSSPVPLADQLVEGLSTLILTGRLTPGARLPSVRSLARRAGVSPFTVTAAFERLLARGLIESRRGSGHFVASNRRALSMQEVEQGPPPQADAAIRFTHSAFDARNIVVAAGSGFVPSSWYDDAFSAAVLSRAMREAATVAASPQGDGELRELLAERLHLSGVPVAARNIVVTAGASQAFDLIARRLLSPGDKVLVEDPGYFVLPTQLKARGLQIVPVFRSGDGPDLAKLEEAARLHRPRMFFTQSLVHNPTGTSASPANCHAVLSLAERYGFLIVEDHAYTDLSSTHDVSLAQIDELRSVLYVGSYSKVLSPGMRVGFVAVPEALVAPLVEAKIVSVLSGSAVCERILREILAGGTYRKHLQRLRDRLARARSIAIQRLSEAGVVIDQPPAAGMFLWSRLPAALDADALSVEARAGGILLAPGPMFSTTGIYRQHLRINAAYAADPILINFLSERCPIAAPD